MLIAILLSSALLTSLNASYLPSNATKASEVSGSGSSTKLRNLWNLLGVTECVLHRSVFLYNNYGCWCGVGGDHTPVDGIDECCMHHDKCYDAAVDSKICFHTAEEYVDPYDWRCDGSKAICQEKTTTCAAALCDCDVAVVDCWGKYAAPAEKAKCNHIDRAFPAANDFRLFGK